MSSQTGKGENLPTGAAVKSGVWQCPLGFGAQTVGRRGRRQGLVRGRQPPHGAEPRLCWSGPGAGGGVEFSQVLRAKGRTLGHLRWGARLGGLGGRGMGAPLVCELGRPMVVPVVPVGCRGLAWRWGTGRGLWVAQGREALRGWLQRGLRHGGNVDTWHCLLGRRQPAVLASGRPVARATPRCVSGWDRQMSGQMDRRVGGSPASPRGGT